MVFYVDGGCRRNGYENAIGAAACCLLLRWDRRLYKTRHLSDVYPTPTNQRAEITAIIMALEWALERYNDLNSSPRMRVKIHSDSKYAIGCMDTWIYKWAGNGWMNSEGREVANRDLIQQASNLDDQLKALGSVDYIWVPREDNWHADKFCNEALDAQE